MMLKQKVTYINKAGELAEATVLLHLSAGDVYELDMRTERGMLNYVNKIIADKNHQAMIDLFEDIVSTAYGKRSQDGKKFEKSEQIKQDFAKSRVFKALIKELSARSPKALGEFIKQLFEISSMEYEER